MRRYLAAGLWIAVAVFVPWKSIAQLSNPGMTAGDVTAIMPQAGDIVPPTDTLTGAIGSSQRYMRQDAPRPTISQRATVTTAADGTWSVTWAKAFISSTPAIFVTPLLNSATQPVTCMVFTRSATSATGKCWQNSVTAVALISLTVSLSPVNFATSSVMVIGLEPSQ